MQMDSFSTIISSIPSEGYPEDIYFTAHPKFNQDYREIIETIKSKLPDIVIDYDREVILDVPFNGNSRYSGQFYQNQRSGVGIERFNSGVAYYGQYKMNLMDGVGFLQVNETEYYKGSFKKGKYHGYGEYYKHNDYYKGYWKNNCKNGNGEEKIGTTVYNGIFKRNQRSGKGNLSTDLCIFEGDFEKDQPVNGKLTHKIRRFTCVAGLANGLLHGDAKIKDLNQKIKSIKCFFSKGEVISGELLFSDLTKARFNEKNAKF